MDTQKPPQTEDKKDTEAKPTNDNNKENLNQLGGKKDTKPNEILIYGNDTGKNDDIYVKIRISTNEVLSWGIDIATVAFELIRAKRFIQNYSTTNEDDLRQIALALSLLDCKKEDILPAKIEEAKKIINIVYHNNKDILGYKYIMRYILSAFISLVIFGVALNFIYKGYHTFILETCLLGVLGNILVNIRNTKLLSIEKDFLSDGQQWTGWKLFYYSSTRIALACSCAITVYILLRSGALGDFKFDMEYFTIPYNAKILLLAAGYSEVFVFNNLDKIASKNITDQSLNK